MCIRDSINAVNSNSSNINTVASANSNVTAVATNISNVNTVAGIFEGTATYTVTVQGGVFYINTGSGVVSKPALSLVKGFTYTFDVSDNTNATHPLRIKSDAGGDQTVTVTGTQGQAGATVVYTPAYPSAPSDLRYYCSTHGNAMGNTITMNNPNTTTQTTTSTSTQQVNPFGTPDPTAEFPQEIYKIDRKSNENREVVTFELAAVFDLAGIRAPKRQCTRTEFPSIGTFIA